MRQNQLRVTAASSLALVVLWSSGFIGAELGTRQAPASTLLAWRYLIAGAILIALCVWRHERISSRRPCVARSCSGSCARRPTSG